MDTFGSSIDFLRVTAIRRKLYMNTTVFSSAAPTRGLFHLSKHVQPTPVLRDFLCHVEGGGVEGGYVGGVVEVYGRLLGESLGGIPPTTSVHDQ